MAKYKKLQLGSEGVEVTDLQKRLNENGANLTVDGKFGVNTLKAVRDYQQKNGLTVDGIVGENTYSSLVGANTTSPLKQDTTIHPDTYINYTGLENKFANSGMPTYNDKYRGYIDQLWQQIATRQPFEYDVNKDALFQQYKDMYMQQGDLAMRDTMGQAAAMTGGYGNSYATTAGNQAYNAYLQQINSMAPEFYANARSEYDSETNDLYNRLAIAQSLDEAEFARYQNDLNNYFTNQGLGAENTQLKAENAALKEAVDNAAKDTGYKFNTGEYEEWEAKWATIETLEQATNLHKAMIKGGVPEEVADAFYFPVYEKLTEPKLGTADWWNNYLTPNNIA